MSFVLRPFRRFPVQCAVTYHAGLFSKLQLAYCSGFGSHLPAVGEASRCRSIGRINPSPMNRHFIQPNARGAV